MFYKIQLQASTNLELNYKFEPFSNQLILKTSENPTHHGNMTSSSKILTFFLENIPFSVAMIEECLKNAV